MTDKIYGVAGKMYQHARPVRNPHYLKFLKRFGCVGCKSERRYRDAMHVGPRGLRQKASDLNALPGCRQCHQQLHRIGPVAFQACHKIEFGQLQEMYRAYYLVEFPDRAPKGEKAA